MSILSGLNQPFVDILKNSTVKLVWVPPENLVSVTTDMKLNQVLEILIDNRILCAPVLTEKKVIGFIDIIDIVAGFYVRYRSVFERNGEVLGSISYSDYLAEDDCLSVLNLSERNPIASIPQETTIFDLIFHFGKTTSRHVLVNGNQLTTLVSQTQTLRFLYEQHLLLDLGDVARMSISDLKIGYREVVSITSDDLAITAFSKMAEDEKSGIAVTVSTPWGKRLIGNISPFDLKDLGYDGESFKLLFLSAGEFLSQRTSSQDEPVSVSENATLEAVLFLFFSQRVHRVYIVREMEKTLLGVITASDIFNLFLK